LKGNLGVPNHTPNIVLMKTIVAVDITFGSGRLLVACFPLEADLQVSKGQVIAALDDPVKENTGVDPTRGVCQAMCETTTFGDDAPFLKVADVGTLWHKACPIRIIEAGVGLDPLDVHHDLLCGKRWQKSHSWRTLQQLALQFGCKVFIRRDTDKRVPKWLYFPHKISRSDNPLYEAMKHLVN
jgi:hypothetical protein